MIYAADNLANETVRLYRDGFYWELMGLPDEEGFLRGPFSIPYVLFPGNSDPSTSIMTSLHGWHDTAMYLFNIVVGVPMWYAWQENGSKYMGFGLGASWIDLNPIGVDASFHNDDPNNPLMIGFKGDKVS